MKKIIAIFILALATQQTFTGICGAKTTAELGKKIFRPLQPAQVQQIRLNRINNAFNRENENRLDLKVAKLTASILRDQKFKRNVAVMLGAGLTLSAGAYLYLNL